MEPTVVITTLSKLIGLGMAFHKAHQSDGFDQDDLSALKAFLDTGSGLLSRKTKDDKPVGAIQLALVARSFGVAMGQHWAFNEAMVPGGSRLPAWVRRIWDNPKAMRHEEIELRLKHANLKMLVPGSQGDPLDELSVLQKLTSHPTTSPYYQALWGSFTNRDLDEEGRGPLLSLEKDGDGREFEKYFRQAYIRALASPEGQLVHRWHIELSFEKAHALQHALLVDTAGWGRRHVFGNALEPRPGDVLPFMPLDEVYVEPYGRRVDERSTDEDKGPRPIKALLTKLLREHHLVVVKADFGHGKSLTARSLAKDFAKAWVSDNRTIGQGLTAPVFIKCVRDIKDVSYEHATVVRRAIWNHATSALGIELSMDDEMFSPPKEQETLFILDGLDEISFAHSQLQEMFNRLHEKARGSHRAMVFTRPGALGHGCHPKGTPIVELLPFQGRPQIEEWIEGWNTAAGQDRSLSWESVAAAGLEDLAKTPILLLMIAMTIRDFQRSKETTTIDKSELYERFFMHIARGKLEHGDDDGDEHGPIVEASKALRTGLVVKEILAEDAQPTHAMLWLMSRVAWMAHEYAYRPGGRPLPAKDVDVRILGEELDLDGNVRRAIEVGLILAMQIDPAGDSKDILFGHQSFREFLVARYWLHQLRRLVDRRNRRHRKTIEEHLRKTRLMQREDAAFSMLQSMLGRLEDGDEKRRIFEWAQEMANNEELSSKILREDRSASLRESALAIGSCISKISLDEPGTLRSLLASLYCREEQIVLRAPGLHSPGALLEKASLEGADLEGADLEGADLQRADLQSADLQRADLQEAILFEARLFGADLEGADLQRANLFGANMRGVNLFGANMEGARLFGANMEGAFLKRAFLKRATLKRATLKRANMEGANLQGATLKRASLEGANLQGANLQGADLQEADLQGANVEGADLEGANLQKARYTRSTKWPTGFNPEAQGAILDPEGPAGSDPSSEVEENE